QTDAAAMRLQEPEQNPEQRRFPGSVRADHQREAAARNGERHAAQHVDPGRVPGMQVLDREQRLAHASLPRYAPITSSLPATSSSVPSAPTRPSIITVTRRQSRRTNAISWLTITKVVRCSRLRVSISSRIDSLMAGAIPANGSSSREHLSRRAMKPEAICRGAPLPPGDALAGDWARGARPGGLDR